MSKLHPGQKSPGWFMSMRGYDVDVEIVRLVLLRCAGKTVVVFAGWGSVLNLLMGIREGGTGSVDLLLGYSSHTIIHGGQQAWLDNGLR